MSTAVRAKAFYLNYYLLLTRAHHLSFVHLRLKQSCLTAQWATPASFSFIFVCCHTNITNFTTNLYVKKCPSSIRCWDSNPGPLEHESPPITTSPGLPPMGIIFVCLFCKVKRYPWAVSYGNKYLDRTIEWTRSLLRSRQVPIPSPQNSDSESGKSILVFLLKVLHT